MESAKGIIIPVVAEYVLTPNVIYGDQLTGIYFETEDEQYGRITFENLDALRICRGEILPYKNHYNDGQPLPWVHEVENSNWQKERYDYEKENYGSSYEFGGNVAEMLSDFNHYVFQFHDQFVEVIARGFWFEKDEISLLGKPLQFGHPFLGLSENVSEPFVAHSLTCYVRKNTRTEEELIANAKFCSQPLIECALELDGNSSVDHRLLLSYRNGKLISTLRGYFGKQTAEFEGIATFNDIKPHIEEYMSQVYERRKAMGK